MKLAIIPARSGSTRIKDKNIINFCGKPLITYSLQTASESGIFDKIHVSTDSKKYQKLVNKLGYKTDFLRDPLLAINSAPITDILRWVVKKYQSMGEDVSDVCMILSTAPLIDGNDIKSAYKLFLEHDKKYPVLSVASFTSPIERGFKIGEKNLLEPIFPEMLSKHSQELSKTYHDAGAFFIIDAEQLINDTIKVYKKYLPYVLPRHKVVGIDEPEDLKMAEVLYIGNKKIT